MHHLITYKSLIKSLKLQYYIYTSVSFSISFCDRNQAESPPFIHGTRHQLLETCITATLTQHGLDMQVSSNSLRLHELPESP